MKVEQKAPAVPAFIPVTLTFETMAELQEFTRAMGTLKSSEGIPYTVWDKLDDIVHGRTNP